jgi:hypothetical protein
LQVLTLQKAPQFWRCGPTAHPSLQQVHCQSF